MRISRFTVLFVTALAMTLGGCFQHGPQYAQYQYVQPSQPPVAAAVSQAPAKAKGPTPRGFYTYNLSGPFAQAQPQAQPQAPAPVYAAAAPVYAAPAPPPPPPPVYSAPPPPVVYAAPTVAPEPVYSAPPRVYAVAPSPVYASPCGAQPCVAASAPGVTAYGYAAQPAFQAPYLLDAGDRLRITVFGQEGLTNSYAVDAAGNVTLPLIGTVPARGMTTEQLSYSLSERLKQGYIREPKVAIEVEAYRPFFIHGEVTTPGQFAYVANMTVENAIAIAGGFGPRADRGKVTVSRTVGGQTTHATVGLSYPLRPGDTLRIGERWF